MLQGMCIGVSVKNINSTEPTNGTITSQNVDYNILWDAMIQCDKKIEARKPDIVLGYIKKEVKIIDVAILGDIRVCEKKLGKIDKYINL